MSALLVRLGRPFRAGLHGQLSAAVAGLVGGLMVLFGTVAMPAAIFTGPLQPYLGVGIGLGVSSTMLTCVALALCSSYPAALGRAHVAAAVGLGIIAASAADRLGPGAPRPVLFGTVLLLIVLSSLSLGLVLLLLGWRRWATSPASCPTR